MKQYYFDPRRRLMLSVGGVLLAAPWLDVAAANDEIIISMSGTPNGSHVWFQPRGMLIQAGQSIKWVNDDVGNAHTVTAYHPDNNKPQRIPEKAASWNSGYLLPGESFEQVFNIPGVYDYFCIPHEQAGMVGRLVVVEKAKSFSDEPLYSDTDQQLPHVALDNLPSVSAIIKNKKVK